MQEVGWHNVQRVDNKPARDWLESLPQEFEVFHWHGETFSLPQDATLLLTSPACAYQAFVWRNMLALQCHVEMTATMVREWAAHEMAAPSATVQSAEEMQQDLQAKVSALHCVADVLYARWLHNVQT